MSPRKIRTMTSSSLLNPTDTDQLTRAMNAHRDGLLDQAQTLYINWLSANPQSAQAAEMLGVLYGQRQQFDEAVRLLQHAVKLDPDKISIRINLGNALIAIKSFDAAYAHLKLAVKKDSSYAALFNLGVCLTQLGRYQEALQQLQNCLKLNIKPAEIWAQIGFCYFELGDYDQSLRCNLEALAHDAHHINAKKNLGFAYLSIRRYALGWYFYENRWAGETHHPQPTDFKEPQWTGYQSLENKTIFVYAEQGLGDCVQFVRYLPLLVQRGGRVIFYTPHTLRRLLISSALPIDLVTSYKDATDFDYQVPLLSLPLAFNTDQNNLPAHTSYLQCDYILRKKWQDLLPKKVLKIGLMWRGLSVPHKKRLTPAALENLLATPNTQFVSLCHDKNSEDESFLARHPEILNYAPFDDLADTAGLMMNLDLIVTVDTVVAHLAGALGIPVLILLHRHADWRWQNDGDHAQTCAWYPSAQLFRQTTADDWNAPTEGVKQLLQNWPIQ